jgi:hypothetical protein
MFMDPTGLCIKKNINKNINYLKKFVNKYGNPTEIMGHLTTIYTATVTEAARSAGLISGAASGAATIVEAPLSDLLFPSTLNAGEREWLFNRELEDFRRVMDEAKKQLDAFEKEYPGIFDDIE